MTKSPNNNITAPKVDCPTCKQKVFWNSDFPFRPFCSKRCQQIDFGEWADEKHSIPGEELPLYQNEEDAYPH